MSQMLSMMKPLPHDAEYPKEFFVDDLEYLPRTIYHIIRRPLWPIEGHSSAAKLEGAMKTLVFYILNDISFNTQEFFIRQLAASGSDLFGLMFYAPWVMRLIKLHSTINYQPSARNHIIFLPEVDIVGERSRNSKFSYVSPRSIYGETSNEGRRVHLHTLVDR